MTDAEKRGYARGYAAAQRRAARAADQSASAGTAALRLFDALVDGLKHQGLSIDDILDAQLIGMRERA